MIEYGRWNGTRATGLHGVPAGRILRHVFDPTRGPRDGGDHVTLVVGANELEMEGYHFRDGTDDPRSRALRESGVITAARWYPVYARFLTPATEQEYLDQDHITEEIAALTGLSLGPRGLI